MRAYQAGRGSVVLSFDDFHPENIRIDEILHTQGIEATFFIETGTAGAMQQIRTLFQAGHDIGGHTIHHPAEIKKLHHVEAMGEIQGCKAMIESATGRACTSFAYPRGRHNEETIELVKRAGFTEARTTHVLQTKYDNAMRTPTTIQFLARRKEYLGRPVETLMRFYLDDVKKNGGTFHFWAHAYELDRDNLWNDFEKAVLLLGSYIEL
jgi:peptidoglycan/xylan/chitin deacetylase (PgdA/CDA1 family)